MNVSCDLIKDLLPLYHDDVCSEHSKTLVEGHVKTCTICQTYLDNLKTGVLQNHFDIDQEKERVKFFKSLKRKLLKKNIIIALISILCAFGVSFGGFFLIFHYHTPISYEEGLMHIEESDNGGINAIFDGRDYYGTYAMIRTITKDGVKKNIAYFYYVDTIWTRHFSKPNKDNHFFLGNTTTADNGKDVSTGLENISNEEISAVYYLIADYGKPMSDKEFAKLSTDAVLLWKE